jgi:hypothetical protein
MVQWTLWAPTIHYSTPRHANLLLSTRRGGFSKEIGVVQERADVGEDKHVLGYAVQEDKHMGDFYLRVFTGVPSILTVLEI